MSGEALVPQHLGQDAVLAVRAVVDAVHLARSVQHDAGYG